MNIPIFYSGLVGLSLVFTGTVSSNARATERNTPLFKFTVASRLAKKPVSNARDLVREISRRHIRVKRAGRVTQPFFSRRGHVLKVKGAEIQVYEYSSVGTARKDAELVGRDGSTVGTNSVNWIEPPHFFRSGRLIVLYIGDQPEVINLLGDILGSQFAGR